MASCAFCGETILFGGVTKGQLRFCNSTCQSKGSLATAAATVPDSAAQALAQQIHMGICPRCQGPGPVDVHSAHWVYSALAFSRWGTKQQVGCRPCAVKTQVGNLLFSSVLGWWGFPWGLVMTPVQVGRTLMAIISPPDPSQPSPKLVQIARIQLASQPRA